MFRLREADEITHAEAIERLRVLMRDSRPPRPYEERRSPARCPHHDVQPDTATTHGAATYAPRGQAGLQGDRLALAG